MRFIMRVIALLIVGPNFSFADEPDRIDVVLPVYSGMEIYEFDDAGREREITKHPAPVGKFANLTVNIPKNIDKDKSLVPEDVYEAVKELRHMLPEEYFLFLLKRFGFVSSYKNKFEHRDVQYEFDDRVHDLEVFLHQVWGLDDLDHKLSQQIECLGNYKYDLTPFFIILTHEEARRRSGDMLVEMHEAVILTSTLAEKCRVY